MARNGSKTSNLDTTHSWRPNDRRKSRYSSGRRRGASQGATRTRSPIATSNPRRKPSIGPRSERRSIENAASDRIGRRAETISEVATETTSSPASGPIASTTRRTIGLPPTSTKAFGRQQPLDAPPPSTSAVSTPRDDSAPLKHVPPEEER